MQKYLEILEQKIEWIALGLAGLWVAYIAWAYWLSAPVTIEVAAEQFGPADVDSFVDQERVRLEERINSTTPLNIPSAPDLAGEFASAMQPRIAQPLPGAVARVDSPPPAVKLEGARQMMPAQALVAALPKPVKTVLHATSQGRSQVQYEKAPDAALVLAALNPNPDVAPDAPLRPVAPGFGAVGVGAGAIAGVPAAPEVVDRLWITVGGFFPVEQLLASFMAANIPEALLALDYLEVQLERSEVLADGKLGKPVLVPPLPKDAPPIERSKDGDLYVQWAILPANQERILRPVFYQVVGGDQWVVPGTPQVVVPDNVGMLPVVVDPATMDALQLFQHWQQLPTPAEKAKFFNSLTTKQKGEVTKVRQEEEEKLRPRPQPRTPGQPINPRPERYQAHDPRVIGEMYAQSSGGAYDPTGGRGGGRGYVPPRPVYNTPQPVMAPGVFEQIIPPGMIQLWAHDETAESGKTYVYRLRVIVRNPMHRQDNLLDPKAKELAKVLDLVQEWSDWSTPVTIPTNMEMQFAGAVLNREQARFKIWRWQNGKLNGPKEFTAGPGDMVGGIDRSPPAVVEPGMLPGAIQAVDYTTGWTVVDVRRVGSSNDNRILMVDEQGRTKTVYMNADLANPKFKKLEPPPVPTLGVGMGG